MDGIGARKREYERLSDELQKTLADFRDRADKHLGNIKRRQT
jgi:hypothetical protein